MENKDDESASFSPSFSTYSGDKLVEIAERVCYKEKGDEEFEFATVTATASLSDDCGGLVFPVFNHNLISETSSAVKSEDGKVVFPVFNQNRFTETECSAVKSDDVSPEKTVKITPLKDLFIRERKEQPPQQTYSSSSDDEEEDELDTIPSEIYCPWTPARSTAEMSPSGGCRKSKSTGSSSTSSWSTKRWRIRDLLKRSKSDGKQSLKFLNSNEEESPKTTTMTKKKEKVSVSVSAHEKFYLRNKAIKEEDKRKSYLPYKQDIVGLFSNINRYGKTFPPF